MQAPRCRHLVQRDREWDTHRKAVADTGFAAIDRFALNPLDTLIA